MKILIFTLLVVQLVCATDLPSLFEEPDDRPEEEQLAELFQKFQEKIDEIGEQIDNATSEAIALAKEPIHKFFGFMDDVDADTKAIFEQANDVVAKYEKIKTKAIADVNKCNDKFIGDSGLLGHLLALKDEIDLSVKELFECSTDAEGMECIINTLLRGETMMNEVDELIGRESDSPEKRAEALLQYIEKCNGNALNKLKKTMSKFVEDNTKCNS